MQMILEENLFKLMKCYCFLFSFILAPAPVYRAQPAAPAPAYHPAPAPAAAATFSEDDGKYSFKRFNNTTVLLIFFNPFLSFSLFFNRLRLPQPKPIVNI